MGIKFHFRSLGVKFYIIVWTSWEVLERMVNPKNKEKEVMPKVLPEINVWPHQQPPKGDIKVVYITYAVIDTKSCFCSFCIKLVLKRVLEGGTQAV